MDQFGLFNIQLVEVVERGKRGEKWPKKKKIAPKLKGMYLYKLKESIKCPVKLTA